MAKPAMPPFDEVRGTYALARNMLDRFPAGRMRDMAIASLEESFSRACFVITEISDPIRGDKKP
jgi:hypothetical protein